MLYLSSANDSQSVLDAESTQWHQDPPLYRLLKTSTDTSEVTENYDLFSGTLQGSDSSGICSRGASGSGSYDSLNR